MTDRQRDLIDLVRALGILQVIVFHVVIGIVAYADPAGLPQVIDRLPHAMSVFFQAMGVDLIFMTSTVLIGMAIHAEIARTGRVSMRAHLVRRMSRILPLYYLAIVVYAAGKGAWNWDILRSFLFVGHVFDDDAIVPVGWSMEAMIVVYALLPLGITALARVRHPQLWLLAAVAATALPRLVYLLMASTPSGLYAELLATRSVPGPLFEVYFRVWFRLTPFLIGLMLGLALAKGQTPPARSVLMAVGAGLVLLTGWVPVQDLESWPYRFWPEAAWACYWAFGPSLFAAGAALWLWGALVGRSEGRLWLAPVWRHISTRIFPIYLFHVPLIIPAALIVCGSTAPEALAQTGLWQIGAMAAVTLGLSLIVAEPLFRFVESPIRQALRRRYL